MEILTIIIIIIIIIYFELLDDLELIESVPPWYSPTTPKPEYHNTKASAFWDVPVFAGSTEVRANRIDVRIIEKETQIVKIIEMSCRWIENRKQKNQEKTTKYAPLRWELKQQHRGYTIMKQFSYQKKYCVCSGNHCILAFNYCSIK